MNVIDFIRLLARKHTPQGHELCPCGSGNKLRNCHKLKFHRLLLGCQNCSAFFLTASGMGSFFSLYQ
ncbi:MAG: SEC-C metal-binding domain-containing protein [Desulfoprunum sp.]